MDEWTRASVKISNQLFYGYRIALVLEKSSASETSSSSSSSSSSSWPSEDSDTTYSDAYSQAPQPTASIDGIQVFERDLDCSSSMDDAVCDSEDLVHNINVEKNGAKDLRDSKFCQKYTTPCESHKCLKGGICLNKEDSLPTHY